MTTTKRDWTDLLTPKTGEDSGTHRQLTRVFLAEDDPDMRRLIKSALSRDGYDVIEASHGVELLELLQTALDVPLLMPDLIILDVLMPGHSGIDVLAALRRANWFTPVIIMSALPDQILRERARELGAVAFFRKPFDVDDFRTAVINASLTGIRARMKSAFDA